jgi:hypothetical protein
VDIFIGLPRQHIIPHVVKECCCSWCVVTNMLFITEWMSRPFIVPINLVSRFLQTKGLGFSS